MSVKNAYTVRQSVAPASDFRNLNVTLAVSGTAQTLIVLGGPGNLECVRKFSFYTTNDCYIDLSGATAVNDGSKATSIFLGAGQYWAEDNVIVAQPVEWQDGTTPTHQGQGTLTISFINANTGETPTIKGYAAGF